MTNINSKSSLDRRHLLSLMLAASLVGCDVNKTKMGSGNEMNQGASSGTDGGDSKKLDKVTLLLNWYPEAEHGGFYAALVHGIYEKHGLKVEIKPGGKTTVVPQELTIGRIEFGIGNADDVVMAREQSAPLVALMAPMQNGPRCIMVREESGIKTFEDLKDITLQIDPARPYVPFMKSKGLLKENVKTVPYFGTVAQLVADVKTAQQAYSFSEPLMAEQQGVKVRNLMMSDIGYNPYASVLIATEEYTQKNTDIVSRMVKASVEGWKKYLVAPQQTNQYILKQNELGMTLESLEYGVQNLKPLCLPIGFAEDNLGAMEATRWETLVNQLIDLKIVTNKVKPGDCFTTKFLATGK